MTVKIDRDVELAIASTNAVVNQCYFFDINGVGRSLHGPLLRLQEPLRSNGNLN